MLSGFIGALIATILTVVYLYIAEQIRQRTDIALEVVGYCDEIYNRLQYMSVYKEKAYKQSGAELERDIYAANSRELSSLVKSTKTHAKLEIIYGAGASVAALNGLSEHFRNAFSLLTTATEDNWAEKSTELNGLFKKVIDPMREGFTRNLIDGTRIKTIMKHLITQFWQ